MLKSRPKLWREGGKVPGLVGTEKKKRKKKKSRRTGFCGVVREKEEIENDREVPAFSDARTSGRKSYGARMSTSGGMG